MSQALTQDGLDGRLACTVCHFCREPIRGPFLFFGGDPSASGGDLADLDLLLCSDCARRVWRSLGTQLAALERAEVLFS